MPVRRIFIPSLGHAKLLLLHHQRLVLLVPGYGRREETAPGLAIIHQPTAIWLHILHRIGEKALVLKRLERHAIDEIAITQSLIHASENAGLTRAENHIPWHGSLRAVYEVVVGLQRLSRIGGGIGIDLPAFSIASDRRDLMRLSCSTRSTSFCVVVLYGRSVFAARFWHEADRDTKTRMPAASSTNCKSIVSY